jgi:hypothetical protein
VNARHTDAASIAAGGARDAAIIAFVHIQKTAGTSMKFVLRHSLGSRHSDVNPVDPALGKPFDVSDLDFARAAVPGLRSISGHEIVEPTRHLAGRVLPYTMLRDPVQRMLSHYQDKRTTGRQAISIDDYLAVPANHDFQVRRIAGGPDLDKARDLLSGAFFFVGLVEQFALSLRIFRALCPYPMDLRCRRKNVARDGSIRERLMADAGLMDRIRAANRLDMRLYAHVEETLLPALQAATGIVDASPLPDYPRWRLPLRFHASRVRHRLVYRRRLKRERRRRGFL